MTWQNKLHNSTLQHAHMPNTVSAPKMPINLSNYKVALVYDKVNTKYGGAEWVLQALHTLFPNAPLFTSVYQPNQAHWAHSFNILPSIVNAIPFVRSKHQWLVPLMPLIFESHNLSDFDIVISITSGEAKGVLTLPHQLHLCYLLTPPRYLYSFSTEYLSTKPFLQLPLVRTVVAVCLRYLRWWDSAAMWRPDKVVTISKLITNRLKTIYGRKADGLLYPPLPLKKISVQPKVDPPFPYLLVLSRLVPYKKIDVAIKAAISAKKNMIIAGNGETKKSLMQLAGKHCLVKQPQQPLVSFLNEAYTNITATTILFVGLVDDKEREWLLQNAIALVMPGIEDFGITALEAAAMGTVPIIHHDSGVAEVLADGMAALHTESDTVSELTATFTKLQQFKMNVPEVKKVISKHSMSSFTSQMQKIIYDSVIQNGISTH